MAATEIKDITDIYNYFDRDADKVKEYIQTLVATTEGYVLPDARELIREVLTAKGGTSTTKGMLIVELVINDIEQYEGLIIPYNNYQEFAIIIDGKSILIDEEIDTHLGREYDYIPSDATWRQVKDRLYNYAIGKKNIKVELFSTYKNGSVYIGYRDKGILKITGKEKKFQLQGEDNVYIQSSNIYPKKNPVEKKLPKSVEEMFDLLIYDKEDEKRQKFLLKVWFYFTFFNPSMKTALCITGIPGTGKSLLQKLLKGTLFGFHDGTCNPNSLPEEDYVFALMMKESKYIFLDEVNQNNKNLKARLRMIVTGEESIFRLKYAKKNIKFKPNLWLSLSAHSPKFREADISQRLLVIKLAHPEKNNTKLIEEDKFMEQMELARGTIWESIIQELQDILHNLEADTKPIQLTNYCRQVEMANFAWKAFPEERDICFDAFNTMDEAQNDFSAEFDPIIDLIETLLEESIGEGGEVIEFTGKTLHERMKGLAQANNIKSFPATVHGLAQWVNRRTSILEKQFGFKKKKDNKKNSYIYVFDKPSTEEEF